MTTLCAWCGKPLQENFISYRGEIICTDCYERKETEVDEWEKYLDKWKTTPPEDEDYTGRTTKCHCAWCNEDLYFDDEYWELDDQILCEDCAADWLNNHKHWVSENMAYEE